MLDFFIIKSVVDKKKSAQCFKELIFKVLKVLKVLKSAQCAQKCPLIKSAQCPKVLDTFCPKVSERKEKSIQTYKVSVATTLLSNDQQKTKMN